ncbi:MAG: AAA family ATPase [Xanthomonadales bacterium]|nr:AAA family ATPase [Xanthomonadales bacterium]
MTTDDVAYAFGTTPPPCPATFPREKSMAINSLEAEHYLLEVKLKRDQVPSFDQYPFSLPVVRNLHNLELHPKVTFIIGENGSGKSTLLEAIAVAWGFNPEGGSKNFRFSTRRSHSELNEYLTLVKGIKRPRDGYFLRAESFFNVATEIERMDDIPTPAPPIIDSYGHRSLHEQSHGESFYSLVTHRLGGCGLYILDEPEAALSPTRQLALLARINDLVEAKSQFIIATHSPILMAYPKAMILQIANSAIEQVTLQETEHYSLSKAFYANPERFLRHLIS